MSNAFLRKAFASTATGSPRIVLIALADSADDEGKCHPGQRYLRVKTALSLSAIRAATSRLIQDGHITCKRGFDTNSKYILHPQIDSDSWAILTERLDWSAKNALLEKVGKNQKLLKKQKATNSNGTNDVIQNMDHLKTEKVIQNPNRSAPKYGSGCSTLQSRVIQNPDTNHNLSLTNSSQNPEEGESIESIDEASKKNPASKREILEIQKPIEVEQAIWDDYLTLRKAKRAGPLTKTALQIIQHDSKCAGISLEEALKYCIKKSWVGFEAEWYLNSKMRFTNVVKGPMNDTLRNSGFKANNSEDGVL